MELNLFKLGQVDPAAAYKEADIYNFQGTLTNVEGENISYSAKILDLAHSKTIAIGHYKRGDGWTVTVEDVPLSQLAIKFSAFGYKSQSVPAQDLWDATDPVVIKLAHDPVEIMALRISLLAALYALAKQKKKSVGALTMSEILPVVVIFAALMGFSVIQKILAWLGIFKSKDTKDLDAASTDAGSFWNPNMWTTKPENVQYSYAITEGTAKAWCDEIDSAFGPFNDCEECAIAVMKRCHTQATASFLCWVFSKYYGEDLLSYLRGGWWPQDRLSDSDVNVINQYISQLPKW